LVSSYTEAEMEVLADFFEKSTKMREEERGRLAKKL
jgi:hypothetical protein